MTPVCNDTDASYEDTLISDALCYLARLVKQHNKLVEASTMLLNRLEADRDVIEKGWWITERDAIAAILTSEPLRHVTECDVKDSQ